MAWTFTCSPRGARGLEVAAQPHYGAFFSNVVCVRVGSLLEQAESLLDMGIHPLRIAEGYEMACKIATAHLDSIATKWDFAPEDTEKLVQTCMTTLSSKV